MPLLQRTPDANKGDHGALGIIGGAQGTVGAAFLSARTALFCGTGRVYVVRPGLHDGLVMDPLSPEVMVIDYAQSRAKPINAWVVGPGLGTSDAARQILTQILGSNAPMVIDADALNLMADDPALVRQCARRNAATIITPHPGEAARLLKISVQDIQQSRNANALLLAKTCNAIAVLKGHETVIATTDGHTQINHTGNVALATGGTGDVLAGLIGALIAQGISAQEAVVNGVRIHGSAAENLTRKLGGPIGITASELIPEVRKLLNS